MSCTMLAVQLFDMGASGVGPVMKKAEMPKVLVDTEKGNPYFSSLLCSPLNLQISTSSTIACWQAPHLIIYLHMLTADRHLHFWH